MNVERHVADSPSQRPAPHPSLAPLHDSLGVIAALVALKLAIHLPLAGRYGYFRDELYFLDLGRHLDWGYVDCAPLIGVYAKLALILGASLPVLRTIAALAGCGIVVMAVLIARELGGGRYAQALAGLTVLATPLFLATSSIMTMNVFEPLFWMGCALVIARIVRTGDSRLWLLFGVLAGLGLENKHSTLFFGAAVAAAVVLTPLRRELARRWIWIGLAIAALLVLPNVLWQITHGFPTIEDLHNVRVSGKNVVLPPLAFVRQQVMMLHPFIAPLWIGGLVSLLVGRLRAWRVLGWTYIVVLGMFMATHGKDYYVAPAYPMLMAAGAVALEGWLDRRALTRGRAWPRLLAAAWVAAAGALVVPFVTPLLSPAGQIAYRKAIGVQPQKTEVAHDGPLVQIFGDQFGWEELVADVARVYNALPPEERAKATVFASNYGEAGALKLLGPRYGLPAPVCAHQNHYFWGPGDARGDVVIWLQWGRKWLDPMFASVEQAAEHRHEWGMAEENRPIYVCRGMKHSFAELWPDLKHWN